MKNQSNVILFDVGANIGEYSTFLFKIFKDCDFKLFCFEPAKNTFERLLENLKGKDVNFNRIGLGSRKGIATLYSDSDNSPLASVFKRDLTFLDIDLSNSEQIEITTLDLFCRENKIEHIDLLKLDVEGNELNVFIGAKKMIEQKKIKYIQFETGGCNIDSKVFWKDIYNLLSPYYKLFRITADGLYEFTEYNEINEIFLFGNYFATLKG